MSWDTTCSCSTLAVTEASELVGELAACTAAVTCSARLRQMAALNALQLPISHSAAAAV